MKFNIRKTELNINTLSSRVDLNLILILFNFYSIARLEELPYSWVFLVIASISLVLHIYKSVKVTRIETEE